ncbi:MAG: hypothetical protein LBE97_02260, partial [Holosporales bacterium]|nr:hypothetical protein [Holosporales bacterium]
MFCKGRSFPICALLMIYTSLTIIRKLPSNKKLQTVFINGLLFGIGYFGSSLYWVSESFYCVGLNKFAYPAVIFLTLYLSLYFGLTFLSAILFSRSRLELVFLFPVFWVCFEYIRGFMFTGFPWNLIGYTSYDIPYFAQIADSIGAYGVSFIFVLFISFMTYKKTFIFGILGFGITVFYGYYKINYFTDYLHPGKDYS